MNSSPLSGSWRFWPQLYEHFIHIMRYASYYVQLCWHVAVHQNNMHICVYTFSCATHIWLWMLRIQWLIFFFVSISYRLFSYLVSTINYVNKIRIFLSNKIKANKTSFSKHQIILENFQNEKSINFNYSFIFIFETLITHIKLNLIDEKIYRRHSFVIQASPNFISV